MRGPRLHFLICRLIVPLWLLAGASYKLWERNPKLLPPPVLNTVLALDPFIWLDGAAWMDSALRLIVSTEFILVGVMLVMPRLARPVSIAVLALFCTILLSVIVPEFQKGGLAQAWKGSCGCFGASGPNPVVMLGIDAALLVLALLARPTPATVALPRSFGLGSAGILTLLAVSVVSFVPDRTAILIDDATAAEGSKAANALPPPTTVDPPVTSTAPSARQWPARPSTAQPYYIPDFGKWKGTRLDSQEIALLTSPPPPDGINAGSWIVMLYREDCDHCHEILLNHFSGDLPIPVLAIAIPDTDPSAALEMPCEKCQLRKLVKGPDYVLTTPVLLRLQDGVISDVVTDHADTDGINRIIGR
ncbi:MAG: hypothetical protein ACKO4V_04405 [Planctomycetota bacterium]